MIEVKSFDSTDGIALQWCKRKGVRTGIISGRKSFSTDQRALQAHMDYSYQGFTEKIPIIEEIMKDSGISSEEIAFVGDDLTDEVRKEAHWVTNCPGGSGAVRDAVELIFQARGFWQEILDHYEVGAEAAKAVI